MKKSSLACLLLSCLGLSAMAETPKGLTDSDWSSIHSAYQAGRHEFHRRDDGSHVAENPGQGWTMQFDGRGFTARPESGEWTWGLELENSEVGPMTAQGNRLTVARGEHLEEWFINDSRGLEQGWTVKERPADAGETLRLSLKVRGGLEPSVSEGSVSFGGGVLVYGGLKAWDATGRVLKACFLPDGEKVVIEVEDDGARYPVTIDPVAQEAYLKASNTGAEDNFGISVAISGDTVVVGARQESSSATTINGDESDNSLHNAGAAYVFARSGGAWIQEAYLKPSNAGADDQFGSFVAIDGETVVVGARGESSSATGINEDGGNDDTPNSGAAYVFIRSSGVWSQQAYLKASNAGEGDEFGNSVAVSGDTVVVGAIGEDSAATGINGNGAGNTSIGSGAAYVFQRSAGVWTQEAYLKASNTRVGDSFGGSVSVSGDIIVIGAYGEESMSTGVDGDENNDGPGNFNAGAAYVFFRSSGIWSQEAYLKASNTGEGDEFGGSVAVSGDTVVVGAKFEGSAATGVNGNDANDDSLFSGAAYVFRRGPGGWTQQAYLKASNNIPDAGSSNEEFGNSVAISGDTVVVGAFLEASSATGIDGDGTNNDAIESGAAYVYTRTGEVWSEAGYLKASNADASDWFGYSVAVSGDTVIVGAPSESSSSTGVDGPGDNEDALYSGAAYVFLVPEIPQATPANLTLSGPVRFKDTKRKKRSRPQTVTVTNTGGSPATSLSASTSLSDFPISPISPAPLAAGASRTVEVTFAPKRKGERSATLTVTSSAPAVSTSLSGKGLDSGRRRKR